MGKEKFMGVELRNKTLGVIGMGRIGSQVVNRCKAFEMDAVAYDPYLPEEVAAQMGVELTDLETVLKKLISLQSMYLLLQKPNT